MTPAVRLAWGGVEPASAALRFQLFDHSSLIIAWLQSAADILCKQMPTLCNNSLPLSASMQ